MEAAFWDSSAIVPLCLVEETSSSAQRLTGQYRMIVWWATPVEVQSALTRVLRMGAISSADRTEAQTTLELVREVWTEVQPSRSIRETAESLLSRFPLRAADALQLAAALAWCQHRPAGRAFLSGDLQLLAAASQLGFRTIQP